MKRYRPLMLAVLAGLLCNLALAAEAPVRIKLDIAPQPLGPALMALGEQSGIQVLMKIADKAVEGTTVQRMAGDFTVREALDRMLARTGLKYEFVNDRTVRISAVTPQSRSSTQNVGKSPMRLSQAETDQPQKADAYDETPNDSSELVVQGTRIDGLINKGLIQTGPDAAVYHNVITRQDIERLGVSSTQELFRFIPQATTASNGLQSAVSVIPGLNSRQSTVSLRGFSSAQTVILINGRQLPRTTAFSSGGPDLDRIPLAAIERIEIMPLAGSAIYGAGAVGGAINVILRKDYSGSDLSLYTGTSTEGGANEVRATYINGSNFNEGRTNLTTTLSYQQRGALRAGQRDYLDEVLERYGPNTTVRSPAGVSAFETFTIPAFGGGATPTLAFFTFNVGTTDLGVPGAPGLRWVQVPAGTTNAQSNALTPASFTAGAGNFRPSSRFGQMMLYEPQETMSANAQLEHKFIPGKLEGYGEFTLGRSDRNYSVPDAGALFLGATDPLNPFRQDVTPGFTGRLVLVYLGAPDIPDARYSMRNDSARTVLGLKGNLNDKWSWSADAAYDYATGDTSVQTPIGNGGLSALTNQFAGVNGAPLATRRAIYNLLADHQQYPILAADADKYFGFVRSSSAHSVQQEYNARLTGELFDLPAGPLQTSVAGKFRTLDLEQQFVQYSTQDFYLLTTGSGTPPLNDNPTEAKRNTWQTAIDLAIPLIGRKWRPIPIEGLDLNLGASRETFDATGHNQSSQRDFAFGDKHGETYVAAVKLQITKDIALRSSYSQGIYPPDWSDLSDLVSTFTSGVGVADSRRGNTIQAPTVLITNGGNPDLQPEEATSQNIGVLFTPRFLQGFSLTVDYWRTRKSDAIVFSSVSGIMANLQDQEVYVTRAAPTTAEAALGWAGVITGIRTGPINISTLSTEGVDIQSRYEFPSPVTGTIVFSQNASFTNHFQTRTLPISPQIETAGAGGPVRWRGYGSIGWEGQQTSVTLLGNYFGHYSSSTTAPTSAFPNAIAYDGSHIPSVLRWDLQLGYTFPTAPKAMGWNEFTSGLKINLGIQNVLNGKPAFVSDGSAFYNRQDDPRQRFIYLSIRKAL